MLKLDKGVFNALKKEVKRIQSIVHIALVEEDYDKAIAFYTNKLHFTLVEDTRTVYWESSRW